MKRALGAAVLLLGGLGCGDDRAPQPCPKVPDFGVSVTSVTGTLPINTKVEVTFGGGLRETYSPFIKRQPTVLFCDPFPDGSGGEGGAAGGAGGAPPNFGEIQRIDCNLWTHGPATVLIEALSWHETRDLKLEGDECHLDEAIVLGKPVTEP